MEIFLDYRCPLLPLLFVFFFFLNQKEGEGENTLITFRIFLSSILPNYSNNWIYEFSYISYFFFLVNSEKKFRKFYSFPLRDGKIFSIWNSRSQIKFERCFLDPWPDFPSPSLPVRVIVIEYSQRWALCIGNSWTSVVVRPEETGTKADPTFLPPSPTRPTCPFILGVTDRRNRKGEFVHHRPETSELGSLSYLRYDHFE